MDEDDPASWPIERVIQELCHSPTPAWAVGTHLKPLIKPELIEVALKENDIDGETLLDLEDQDIKTDLHVTSFGQRRLLRNIVSHLRSISKKYQLQRARVESHAIATPLLSHTSVASLARSPSYSTFPVQNSIETKAHYGGPSYESRPMSNTTTQNREMGTLNHRNSIALLPPINNSPHLETSSEIGAGRSAGTIPSTPRQQSQSIFNTLDSAIDQELDVVGHSTNGNNNVYAPEASSPAPDTSNKPKKAPKRATLIPVTDRVEVNRQFNWPMLIDSGGNPLVESRNGQIRRLSVDARGTATREELTFKHPKAVNGFPSLQRDSSSPGRHASETNIRKVRRADQILERNRDNVANSLDTAENEIDLSQEFLIWGSARAKGQAKHIARKRPLFKELEGPNSAPDRNSSHSLHDVPSRNGFRTVMNTMSSDLPTYDLDAEDLAFLQKYPADQNGFEYPLWGESDEEDRYTSRSEESPQPADSEVKHALPRIEVDAIIDETLEQYRVNWRKNDLVRIQAKAHRKWMIAAKNKIQYLSILEACTRWRDKACSRIESLRNGIHLSHWRKTEDVKHQCLAIQASVELFEEYNLYVEVLRCQQEPYLPSRSTLGKVARHRSHTIMDNGDEELDSDDTDLFIVDDTEGQIPNGDPLSSDQQDMAWEPQLAQKPQDVSARPKTDTDVGRKEHDMNVDDGPSPDPLSYTPPTQAKSMEGFSPRSDKMDLDSDEEDIISPMRRQIRSTQKQAAIEGAGRNPLNLPTFTDSSEYETDFERAPRGHSKKYRKLGSSEAKVIDLTGSSPQSGSGRSSGELSDLELLRTPKRRTANTSNSRALSSISRNSDSSDPVLALVSGNQKHRKKTFLFDIKTISKMNWEEIEPANEDQPPDGRLALAKAVYSLPLYRLNRLDDYFRSFRDEEDVADVVRNGLDAEYQEEDEILEVDQKNQNNAKEMTHLLITYATGCHVHPDFEMSEKQLNDGYDVVAEGFPEFCQLLRHLLKISIGWTGRKRASDATSSNEPQHDTDNDSDFLTRPREPGSASKVRARKVAQSKDVLAQQQYDQQRVQEQEKRRKLLLEEQSRQGASSDQLSVSININEPIVYLPPGLAARVKPHQVDGIRFMWREIIENPRGEGCLLAHTMGLGKTMQVISLLASIAQCNHSADFAMQDHIPEHLQRLRVMILCPMALIENWYQELQQWLPDSMMLGVLWKLDSLVKQPEVTIENWFTDGGVLIVGYEKFQRYVAPKKVTNLQEGFIKRRRHLLEGPDIVIADEAHRLKNAKSLINSAARQIITKSRIALTGSPLNNHLEEYHTMIDWISPRYLGNMIQFKARYVEPINRGLYSESTAWERKASMKRLHMLKRIIAPKISRADITAISKDLPPKTEFFLTIALTKEQEEAYKVYVEDLRASSTGVKTGNTRIWSWLNILGLLLNHPSCFVKKLKQREESNIATQSRLAESEDDGYDSGVAPAAIDNLAVGQEPELENAMEKVMNVFAEARVLLGMDDPSLSNKTLLIKRIIEEAVRVNEKTLIFSKSILTLDYYESMVRDMGLGYMRIDGQSQSKAGSRSEDVAQFNNSKTLKVFLISTRAGGLGLNIQSASRVIISDFDFNPTWEEQAVGRAYRMGQKKAVFVYRFLMGGTFEELIHNKAVFKTQLFTRVVDERNVISQAKQKPGEFLFSPKEVPQKDFNDCLGKDPKVLDKVLQADDVTCVRDIILTETFFQDADEELNEQDLKEANEQLELEQLERDNPEEYAKRMRLMAQEQRARHQMQYQSQQTAHEQGFRPQAGPVTTTPFYHFLNLEVPNNHGSNNPSGSVRQAVPGIPANGRSPRTPTPGTAYSDDFVPTSRSTGQPLNHIALFRDDQSQTNRQAPAMTTRPSSSTKYPFIRPPPPTQSFKHAQVANSHPARGPTSSTASVAATKNQSVERSATRDGPIHDSIQNNKSTQKETESSNTEPEPVSAGQCRPQ